jgi:hypothetical protein
MAQKGDTFQLIGVSYNTSYPSFVDPLRLGGSAVRNNLDARVIERAKVVSSVSELKDGVPTVVLFHGIVDNSPTGKSNVFLIYLLKQLKAKNPPAILLVIIVRSPPNPRLPYRNFVLADWPAYEDAAGLANVTAVTLSDIPVEGPWSVDWPQRAIQRRREQNAPANDAIWRWVQEHDLRFKAERARFGLALVAENAPSTLTQLAMENGMDERDMKALLSNIFESRVNPRPARKRVAVVEEDDGDESGSASGQPPLKRTRDEVAAALIARRGNVELAAQDLMRDG